ncbi:hypothetical protein RR46_14507 [Papilio xuthus]|uniref:C-type lectin domain-containing protein n=1 Tax=Papilio xuthus TaxID=66420 RepID=A0A194PDB8_PAPXU|nr:hypothetical protein RR46_14507 [Papilio xuthus]
MFCSYDFRLVWDHTCLSSKALAIVQSDDIRDIGFDRWAGDNGLTTSFYVLILSSNDVEEPHCAALDAVNPGLRDWWCHLPQPFLCQMQLDSED